MVHKPGSPREFGALLENRPILDRQGSCRAGAPAQLPPFLAQGLGSPGAPPSAQPSALLLGHSPVSKLPQELFTSCQGSEVMGWPPLEKKYFGWVYTN